MGLRWAWEGFLGFFDSASEDLGWNILDVLIVGLDILGNFFQHLVQFPAFEHILSNVSILRLLRIMRIVRVIRVIRLFSFFKELRLMLTSILSSMTSILWVGLVLGMCFYMFGVAFTSATTDHFLLSAIPINELSEQSLDIALWTSFGTLEKSAISLYKAISGGEDWGAFYDPLKSLLDPLYPALFLFFVTFCVYMVANIVTSVFVDSAIQNSTIDREVVILEEMRIKENYLQEMRDIFEEIDSLSGNGDGDISLDEFQNRLQDERVVAYFSHLRIDVSDVVSLFSVLDIDNSGSVTIDEFLTGCWKLAMPSSNLEMKLMNLEVSYLKRVIQKLSDDLVRIERFLRSNISFAGAWNPNISLASSWTQPSMSVDR